MNELKKGQHELLPLDLADVPPGVISLVEDGCAITGQKRFRARNWRKTIETGMVFITTKGTVVLIQEATLLQGQRHVPAWNVSVTGAEGHDPLAHAVDGMYCHTAVKVSFFGHNVPVNP